MTSFDPKKNDPLDTQSLVGSLNGRLYDQIKGLSKFCYDKRCDTAGCIENKVVFIDKYTLQQKFSENAKECFENFLSGKLYIY